MRDLKIAYGNSRQATFWSNKTTAFVDLCERLKTPIRTSETVSEYKAMTRPERDAIKDRGGFVAGHLRDNRRKIENVVCRSMVVYDIDKATTEFVDDIQTKVRYKCCFYSTHSHTPDAPRIRLILPAMRDMTTDDHYGSFSQRNLDIAVTKVADDRSYHPIREMFDSLPERDGVPRVDTLLIDYLGASDNEYTRAVTRKTLCAAYMRVYNPGIKFDNMIVLNGLHLAPEIESLAKGEQRDAMESDEREGLVREYLETLLPENWDDMDLYDRRAFFADVNDIGRAGTVARTRVCNMEIWCELFGKDQGSIGRAESNNITAMLTKIGWVRKEKKERIKPYGPQFVFVPNNVPN